MVERTKPHPDIYIKACELLFVKPENCIALEDSNNGILSAHNAGLKPIMIPDLLQPTDRIEKLLFGKLSNLAEVIDFLRALRDKVYFYEMRRYTQMLDCHIHIERGEYKLDWINEFVKVAVKRGLNEIWLLEHSYRFREFLPMYDSVCIYSDYINKWFHSKAGVFGITDYLRLIDSVRSQRWPVNIKFGLEVCYFKQFENFVYSETKDKELDFLVGSVHFIDDFAYDHKPEHWVSVNVDNAYRRYFETSIDLAESRLYSGIAHPDCIKLFGHKPSFALNDYYDRLAAVLAKNNMYVEQNSGSFRRCPDTSELGMDAGLIKAIKKHGVKIKTASDAHCPEDVGLYIKELEAQLYSF